MRVTLPIRLAASLVLLPKTVAREMGEKCARIGSRRRKAGERSSLASNAPVADSSLAALQRETREAIQRHSPRLIGVIPRGWHALEEISADAEVAFKSRYHLEREVRQLWHQFLSEEAPRQPLYLLVESLESRQILPPDIAASIQTVSRVASPAIHAQPISQAKIDFLKELVPELLAALQAMRQEGE